MMNQLTFIEIPETNHNKTNNLKRNWENRFQRYINKYAEDELTPFGKCGWGAICEYCDCKFEYKNQCVRALRELQAKRKNCNRLYERLL